jgi:hypothetical protein
MPAILFDDFFRIYQMRVSSGILAAFAILSVNPPAAAQHGVERPTHLRISGISQGPDSTRNGMERPSFKTHAGVYLSRPLVRLRPSPAIKGPQALYVIAGDDPRP